MFNTILLDLDGTLSDSYPGISRGILYTLEKIGIPAPDSESLRRFIGPPLFSQFKAVFGLDDDTANEAVKLYREYYSEKGIFEQTLIDGAAELLESLKSNGKIICLATSKPQQYAEKILKNFGIDKFFTIISGATMDGKISEKHQVIELAMEKTHSLPDNSLMVGDTRYDVEGAHRCGIKCAGILCGFGSREELERSGADFIAEKLTDISYIVSRPHR